MTDYVQSQLILLQLNKISKAKNHIPGKGFLEFPLLYSHVLMLCLVTVCDTTVSPS